MSWQKTCWINDDGFKVTIQDVLERLKDTPVIHVEISAILRNPKILIDSVKRDNADTSKFILIHNDILLDGYHRVEQALRMGQTHIPAKVLRGNLFSTCSSAEEQWPSKPLVAGSNPARCAWAHSSAG